MFLVVMSILVIIVGAVIFLIGLVGGMAGIGLSATGAMIGSGFLVGLGAVAAVVSLVGGSLELIAGICSVRGKALIFCLIIAILLVILSVISLVGAGGSDAAGGSSTFISVLAVLIFHVLYFIAVILGINRKRAG